MYGKYCASSDVGVNFLGLGTLAAKSVHAEQAPQRGVVTEKHDFSLKVNLSQLETPAQLWTLNLPKTQAKHPRGFKDACDSACDPVGGDKQDARKIQEI